MERAVRRDGDIRERVAVTQRRSSYRGGLDVDLMPEDLVDLDRNFRRPRRRPPGPSAPFFQYVQAPFRYIPDMRLDGKVAVVTGATRGAGRGIASELAPSGARVFVTGRSVEEHQPADAPITASAATIDWMAA